MPSPSVASPAALKNHTLSGPIVCLLPSATEIVFAVGAGSRVVGVTHECDHPPGVSSLPHVTRSLLPPDLTSAEIDTAVCRAMTSDAHTIYALEKEKLARLEPEAIVTQALCDVCAVPERNVQAFACSLPERCKVVSADPETLEELFESIRIVGEAVCAPATEECILGLRKRLERISLATEKFSKKQRVAVLEWPDPPYAPGHWFVIFAARCQVLCIVLRGEISCANFFLTFPLSCGFATAGCLT